MADCAIVFPEEEFASFPNAIGANVVGLSALSASRPANPCIRPSSYAWQINYSGWSAVVASRSHSRGTRRPSSLFACCLFLCCCLFRAGCFCLVFFQPILAFCFLMWFLWFLPFFVFRSNFRILEHPLRSLSASGSWASALAGTTVARRLIL